jgi:hypothetical protein
VADADDLAAALVGLLRDPQAALRLGEEGRLELSMHRGSAERAVRLIEALLEPAASPAR